MVLSLPFYDLPDLERLYQYHYHLIFPQFYIVKQFLTNIPNEDVLSLYLGFQGCVDRMPVHSASTSSV